MALWRKRDLGAQCIWIKLNASRVNLSVWRPAVASGRTVSGNTAQCQASSHQCKAGHTHQGNWNPISRSLSSPASAIRKESRKSPYTLEDCPVLPELVGLTIIYLLCMAGVRQQALYYNQQSLWQRGFKRRVRKLFLVKVPWYRPCQERCIA